MGIDVVGHRRAGPERQRSHWSTVTAAAAVLVWVGGVLLHVLGVLAPMVAVVGLLAGVVATARERRPIWRAATVVATLASLGAIGVYALVLTGTVRWPPTG